MRRETHIVIEEEQPLLRLDVVAFELALRDEGRLTGHIGASQTLEQFLRENRCPGMRGVGGDRLI